MNYYNKYLKYKYKYLELSKKMSGGAFAPLVFGVAKMAAKGATKAVAKAVAKDVAKGAATGALTNVTTNGAANTTSKTAKGALTNATTKDALTDATTKGAAKTAAKGTTQVTANTTSKTDSKKKVNNQPNTISDLMVQGVSIMGKKTTDVGKAVIDNAVASLIEGIKSEFLKHNTNNPMFKFINSLINSIDLDKLSINDLKHIDDIIKAISSNKSIDLNSLKYTPEGKIIFNNKEVKAKAYSTINDFIKDVVKSYPKTKTGLTMPGFI